jgi:hypothetical protein
MRDGVRWFVADIVGVLLCAAVLPFSMMAIIFAVAKKSFNNIFYTASTCNTEERHKLNQRHIVDISAGRQLV